MPLMRHGWYGKKSHDNDLFGDFVTQISCSSCATTNRAAKTLTALLSGAAILITALFPEISGNPAHSEFKGPVALVLCYMIMSKTGI